MNDYTLPTMPQPPDRPAGRGLFDWFGRWWNRGPWQKALVIAVIPLLLVFACCSGGLIFAATPAGQQFAQEGAATETAQALANAQATATASAYALAHPSPTSALAGTPQPTSTPQPTITPQPTSTPQATITPQPTATPRAIVTGPTLAGPDSAFQKKYGSAPDDLWDINGVTFSTNLDTAVDSQQHAFQMLVYRSNAGVWTLAQARSVCAVFLPPDARFSRTITSSAGNPEDVYISAEAAATFAPSSPWYTSDGSVSIDYEPPSGGTVSSSGVFQCSLSTGV